MNLGEPGASGPDAPASATDSEESAPAGLLGSLRGFVDGVFGSVRDRIELISLELQEEKQRLIQAFAWVTAFVLLAMLAAFFASCALVVAFWDTAARLPIIASLAVAYGLGAWFAGVKLRRYVQRASGPFSATLEELDNDRACLRPKS